MQNRGRALVGAFLLLLGIGFLLANVLKINFWAICFPAGLILIGVLCVLLRPKVFDASSTKQLVLVRRCEARQRLDAGRRRDLAVVWRRQVGFHAGAAARRRNTPPHQWPHRRC